VRNFVYSLLVLPWLLLPSAESAFAQKALLEGSVENLNVSFDPGVPIAGSLIRWSHTEQRTGSEYVRVFFSEISDATAGEYSILIKNRNGNTKQKILKSEFGTKTEFWSDVIEGDFLKVEIVANDMPTGLTFKLGKLAFQTPMGAPFSISLPDDREPIFKYANTPPLNSLSQAVAKLTFIVGANTAMCTGFLIDDERMLTNEHCINRQDACASAMAIFGLELLETGGLRETTKYRCQKFIASDHELDVAIIRLDGKPGLVWGHMILNDRKIVGGEQTYMIQHPAGQPKQISRKDCSVTTAAADGNGANTDFGHKCDTLGGSSGSPVLGSDFTVVGLHHLGFDSTDGRWVGENRAVRMERLLAWVNSHK
jgi:V8-like Glu-specific endopeptidase